MKSLSLFFLLFALLGPSFTYSMEDTVKKQTTEEKALLAAKGTGYVLGAAVLGIPLMSSLSFMKNNWKNRPMDSFNTMGYIIIRAMFTHYFAKHAYENFSKIQR